MERGSRVWRGGGTTERPERVSLCRPWRGEKKWKESGDNERGMKKVGADKIVSRRQRPSLVFTERNSQLWQWKVSGAHLISLLASAGGDLGSWDTKSLSLWVREQDEVKSLHLVTERKKKKTQMDEWTSECSHLMDRLLEHAQWAVEHMWLYSVGLKTESEHLAWILSHQTILNYNTNYQCCLPNLHPSKPGWNPYLLSSLVEVNSSSRTRSHLEMKEKKNTTSSANWETFTSVNLVLFWGYQTSFFFRNVRIIWITGLYEAPLDAGRSINKTGWEDVSNPAATRTR